MTSDIRLFDRIANMVMTNEHHLNYGMNNDERNKGSSNSIPRPSGTRAVVAGGPSGNDPSELQVAFACTKAGPTRPSTVCFISLMGTIPSLWHAAAWEQQAHSAHLEIVDKSSPARRPYRRLKKL